MIVLYSGSGAGDFETSADPIERVNHEALMLNARQVLRLRGHNRAIEILQRTSFHIFDAHNHFCDEFDVLKAEVPVREYEEFRTLSNDREARQAFAQIAEVLTEIGEHVYIRFIAVDLQHQAPESWDVFVCHASEDKQAVVEPLCKHLDVSGIRPWFDRGEILWGDSIVEKIGEGLSCSRFVIVVVSPSLLKKNWAIKEMNSALHEEIESGETRLLPLMVGSEEEIQGMRQQLSLQRDKRYLTWEGCPEEIEQELRALIRRSNLKGHA